MEFFKQTIVFIAILGIIGVAFYNIGYAEEKTWTYDGVEYHLPKPVEELQLPADIPESHTVVSGDCLWAIAGMYLNDPFLWPLVWEVNLDTISNPHLIYPGDVVLLPGGTMMAAETMPPAKPMTPMGDEEGAGEGEDTGAMDTAADRMEPKPFPVTSETDLISSGFIAKEQVEGPKIIAAETDAYDLAKDDVVFVEPDSSVDLKVDDTYFVLREKHIVRHPVSNRRLGRMYHIMAEATVMCVNDSIVSARITKSYHSVLRGDILVPWEEIPIPMTFGTAPIDPCNPSSKKLPGNIVDAFVGGPGFSDAVILAEGDIAYIDLGSKDGVAPGDYFTVFKRDSSDPILPRYVSGEAMVIKVQETTSVVVVTNSRSAIFLGDQIELKQ